MPSRRMKHRRVAHKSTAGILPTFPEAVDLVDNPPPRLTENTVALPKIGERSRGILFAVRARDRQRILSVLWRGKQTGADGVHRRQ
jgi:hypothetical protein